MLRWSRGTHLEHCIVIGFILFALETKYNLFRNFYDWHVVFFFFKWSLIFFITVIVDFKIQTCHGSYPDPRITS